MDEDKMPPVAVIGMACRYPGDASSPEAFFQMLSEGRSAWSEVPKDRFLIDSFYHPSKDRIGATRSRGAHWMKEDISLFDAPFFSLSAAEAIAMDPQLRMLLEVTYECMESSGTPMEKLVKSQTSVHIASSSQEYPPMMMADIDSIPLYSAVGTGTTMLANRISHFYDLRGPSITMDTACSGSLVALHLACQSIRAKESRVGIVGAGQVMIGPDGPAGLSRLQFLSPTSRCHTFDESADGYSRGEGICVMMLKSLEDALTDGDTIRAVIRGTGTNQDGKTPGIVQPNSEAQAALIRSTYAAAGLNYTDTHYFEAHGTGTRVGDPLELGALSSAFGTEGRNDGRPLYVGSVKTNIGHLEGGAGLAGLLKTILCIEKGVIVPHINFEKPNPKLRLDEWNLRVPTELTPWPSQGLRRASINSFGYGGSNAHCIVDDAYNYLKLRGLQGKTVSVPRSPLYDADEGHFDSAHGSSGEASPVLFPESGSQPRLFVFSSPEQAALQRMATKYASHLESKKMKNIFSEQEFLADLAFTLGSRRSLLQWKSAVVASSIEELVASLRNLGKSYRAAKRSGILYVFTGQGAQWYAMGRALQRYDRFAQSIEEADQYMASLGVEWSVVEELNAPEETSKINLAKYSQPLCTVLQIALVDLLSSWGVQPAAVCGHSSGEIAAAYACGALSAQDCWKISYHRGRLSDQITARAPELNGSMMSVGLSEEAVLPYLDKLTASEREQVVVACVNSPSNVTLSGASSVLQKLEHLFKDDKVFARALKVEVAYHSPHMRVIADDYLEAIKDIQPNPAGKGIAMASSVTGATISPNELTADYWVRNMVSPVQFTKAVGILFPEKSSRTRGRRNQLAVDSILELGPHSALQGPLRQILQDNGRGDDFSYASAILRGKDAIHSTLDAVGQLWMRGQPVDLARVNVPDAGLSTAKVLPDLPNYAWNHTHKYWQENEGSLLKRMRRTPRLDLVGYPITDESAAEQVWRNIVRQSENPWLADHKIQGSVLFPAASMICSVIEAAKQLVADGAKFRGVEFRDIIIGRAMVIPTGEEGVDTLLHIKRRKAGTRANESFWWEFVLYSKPKGEGTVEHCSGLFQIQTGDAELSTEEAFELESLKKQHAELQRQCTKAKAPQKFYSDWAACGMGWGPAFQGIKSVMAGENYSCTQIEITDTKSTMPEQFEYPHTLHPTTLDACFQAIFGPLSALGESKVPTGINSLYVSASMPQGAGSQLSSFSSIFKKGFNTSIGKTVLADPEWSRPLIILDGMTLTRVQSMDDQTLGDKQPWEIRKIVTNMVWKEDVELLIQADIEEVFASSSAPLETTVDICNSRIAKWISLNAHKLPSQRILHLAGGNGDLSLKCLQELGGEYGRTPFFSKYVIADSDFESAKARLEPWLEWVDFKAVDVGVDLTTQEFEESSFDVIVVENVPGTNKARELSHFVKLLVPGGKLIFSDLTGPGNNEDHWNSLLKESGFADSNLFIKIPDHAGQSHIIISEKPAKTDKTISAAVVVLPENYSAKLEALANQLHQWLQELGVIAEVATLEKATLRGQSGTMLVSQKHVVSLLEAENPFVCALSEEDFGRLQRLLLESLGGVWVSRGNRTLDPSGDPFYGAAQGLLRCFRNEKPEIRMHEFALSTTLPTSSPKAFDLITRVTAAVWKATALGNEAETEIGERNGQVYIPRLVDDEKFNHKMDFIGQPLPAEMQPLVQKGNPLRLEIGTAGMLDTLRFVYDPLPSQPLEGHDVEIEVRANGMNFVDIMVSMGLVADTELGADAAGVISRVGPDVTTVKPGDRVATFCIGAYRSFLRSPESLVARIPDTMSYEEAAALPCVYVTAYRALVEVAHLSKGESILIHSAAGGLGQAAIQLAQHIGAEIYVTAGSNEKRQLLNEHNGIPEDHIFNSRDLAFAQGIKRMTNGKGVDVVLNSLSGEGLRKTWECVATFGRFIEVGKRDILGNTGLDMSPFLYNVTFAGVNLEHMLRNDRVGMARVLRDTFELIQNGSVGAIKPLTVYPFSEMEKAFRTMQLARHTGKMVLSVKPDDVVKVVPRDLHPVQLKADATYVIAGGLGGIGRSLVLLLAKYGAKNVAFLSRSGAAKPEAQATLAELEELGVDATSYICDIADETSFKATMEKIAQEKPPVKGAIHAAMVLNDILIEDMTYKQWFETTRCKISGGWNMHRLLPQDMDFFVMMSSASGYMGSAMLGNYASGNTFLDALAQYRRARGQAATALGLGFIAGMGWAKDNVKVMDEFRSDYDLMSLSQAQVFSLVESGITGYAYGDTEMPPALPTTVGTGGELQHTKFIKTRGYYSDAKYAYIRRLDVHEDRGTGGGRNETAVLIDELKKASSHGEAAEKIEEALASKLSSSMSMRVEDIDTSKPVSVYGVDSLVSMEIRNWIHAVLRSNVGVFDILRAIPMSQLASNIADDCAWVPEEVRKESKQS